MKLGDRFRLFDPVERVYTGYNGPEIVDGDKADILEADIVLVFAWKMSVGTAMEIAFAHSVGKYVILVMEDALTQPERVNPWYLHHSSAVFEDIDEALNWMIHSSGSFSNAVAKYQVERPLSPAIMGAYLTWMCRSIHKRNETWWRNPATGEALTRNVGEMLCLVHSELSEGVESDMDGVTVLESLIDELIALRNGQLTINDQVLQAHQAISRAMEAHRKAKADDKLPQYNGLVVELDDALIRMFDILGGLGYAHDAGSAFRDKLNFNAVRPDHKPEARLAEGGKKY
jgi:hypothetical protein